MMTRRKNFKMSDPTRPAANGDERQLYGNGLIFDASIAASVSAQGETGGGVTVTMPANSGRQESGNVSPDTPASTKRIATVTHCEQCGDEFMPRRPWGRFCSAYCRRLAWLDRNPERATALAESDIQRLREHVIGGGGEWRDRCNNGA